MVQSDKNVKIARYGYFTAEKKKIGNIQRNIFLFLCSYIFIEITFEILPLYVLEEFLSNWWISTFCFKGPTKWFFVIFRQRFLEIDFSLLLLDILGLKNGGTKYVA